MELVEFADAYTIATTVARKVHRKYTTYFDWEDVAQELTLWLNRRWNKVDEWLDHPPESEEYKAGVKLLAKTLTRHADKYCRKKKSQKVGYELRDEQFYAPVLVAELLPFVWADVLETKDNNKPKVSGSGNPAEGGNYVIQLFDVRSALLRLPEQDRTVLRLKYYEQETFAQIAEELQVSESTAHRKVDNAIRKLINLLGGPSPYSSGDDI